jgi:uncharacterized repeat protein (TIGR01451 family)
MITQKFGSFEVTGDFNSVDNNSNLLQTSADSTTTIAINDRQVLKIKGQTTIDFGSEKITVNGDIFTDITGNEIEIFSGEASFSAGSQLHAVWDKITSKLNISGFSVTLSSLALTSAGLQIQGSITLPDILGGEAIAIEDNNFILINSGGISLSGGKIELPGQREISVGNITLETNNLSLSISDRPESFVLQGDASLVGFIPGDNFSISADFDPPGFIEIDPERNPVLSVDGDISLSDLTIVTNVLELKQFVLGLDTLDDAISAEAILDIPDGIQLKGSIAFLDGKLDAISFSLDAENSIPLFEGVNLTSFGGDVENIPAQPDAGIDLTNTNLGNEGIKIASAIINEDNKFIDPDSIAKFVVFERKFELKYAAFKIETVEVGSGNAKDILESLQKKYPDSLVTNSLVEIQSQAESSDRRYYILEELEADGKIQTSEPVFIGDIEISAGISDGGSISVPGFLGVSGNRVDLSKFVSIQGDVLYTSEVLALAATIDLFDPKIAKGDGTLILDSRSKTINADVNLDIFSGLITSSDQFTINSKFDVVVDGDISINVPKKIGDFHVPFIGGKSISADYAFQFINDGESSNDFVAFWGRVLNIGTFGVQIFFDGHIRTIGHAPALESSSWTIFEETEYLLLEAAWENPVDNVQIIIETPDGNSLTEDEFAANGIEFVDSLTDTEGKVVKINNPQLGRWDIKVQKNFLPQVGEVFYHAALPETERPSLEIGSPRIIEEGSTVHIPYQLEDIDSDATVSFFYSDNNQIFDGSLITHGLPENQDYFTWDTKGVAPGTYFIYGRAMDELNAPVYIYAPEVIAVTEAIDISLEQIVPSTQVVIDQPFTYQLELANNSDFNATDLTIVNALAENTKFISANFSVEQNGQELIFNIDSLGANETKIIDIEIMPTALGDLTSRAEVDHPAYDENINNNRDFFSVNVVNPETQLTRLSNNIFSILSNSIASQLNFQLLGENSEYVNEVGFFFVENEQGTIIDDQGNQFNPGDEEYTQQALSQSQVIFSALNNLPNGFEQTELMRTVDNLQSGDHLVFFFVENATAKDVVQGTANTNQVFFGSTFDNQTFNPLEVTFLGDDSFNLAWQTDASNSIYDEMTFFVDGSAISGMPNNSTIKQVNSSGIIDLTGFDHSVPVDVSVYREAAFDNLIGFYAISDLLGSVDGVTPGSANYTQVALENRVPTLDLMQVENQQTNTFSGFFDGGNLFAPFIIADGSFEDGLNGSADVFFPFLGANTDGVDHIRLLANNTLGFEDILGGGDQDFNDIIVQLDFLA